jgi:DNA polymerase III alpha subunit
VSDAPKEKPKPQWSEIDEFLKFKVLKGLKDRGYPTTQKYLDRVAMEGQVICATGYAPYFLIVSDLCRFMREKKIRFLVRGSGCGSIYVWALGISHAWLDPIELELPFERFLNIERISMPDLDIDIQDDRRHEVVTYTVEKYGKDRVARIISFGTLGARAAIKDLARALDLPDYQIVADKITKAIPVNTDLDDALKASELLQEMEKSYPRLFEMARRVEGKTRHTTVHAAGVVIAPDEMTKFMPVYYTGNPADRDPADWEPVTSWDMYDVEERGLLKMDYLGLKTLRVIDQSERLINFIREKQGLKPDFSIDTVDRRDQKAWELLAAGRLAGVFQVERKFVRNFAKRMNLLKFKDPWQLAILIAIIRPGMMDTGQTEIYLRRASGEEEPTPLHALLEQTLRKTFGIMVFQEDTMFVARDLSKFTMAKADVLRKGIGKKKPEFVAKMYPPFESGAVEQNVAKEDVQRIWGLIEAHSRYSFNNAHAAAYGLVGTYQTAYLKANYPLVYMTCLTNSEAGVGTKEQGYNCKVAEYVEEARTMGIGVLPPCVRASSAMCRVDLGKNAIRFGLSLIKGVGDKAAAWITTRCREAKSFKEFLLACFEELEVEVKPKVSREEMKKIVASATQPAEPPASSPDPEVAEVQGTLLEAQVDSRMESKKAWKSYSRVGKGEIESLIHAGAFDSLDSDREKLLAMVEDLLSLAAKYHEQSCKVRNGSNRLKLTPEVIKEQIDAADLDEVAITREGLEKRLELERAYTGCYLSESPFQPYRKTIDEYETTTIEEVLAGQFGKGAVFAGILRDFRIFVIKNGKNKGREMGYFTFAGVGGDLDVTCFADQWDRLKPKPPAEGQKPAPPIVERGKVYMVQINPDRNGGTPVMAELTRLSNTLYAEST